MTGRSTALSPLEARDVDPADALVRFGVGPEKSNVLVDVARRSAVRPHLRRPGQFADHDPCRVQLGVVVVAHVVWNVNGDKVLLVRPELRLQL